jgi:hypothetical protein
MMEHGIRKFKSAVSRLILFFLFRCWMIPRISRFLSSWVLPPRILRLSFPLCGTVMVVSLVADCLRCRSTDEASLVQRTMVLQTTWWRDHPSRFPCFGIGWMYWYRMDVKSTGYCQTFWSETQKVVRPLVLAFRQDHNSLFRILIVNKSKRNSGTPKENGKGWLWRLY